MQTKQTNLRVFWRCNALLSIILFLCFFWALYSSFMKEDSQLRQLAQYIGYCSIMQLLASMVFSIAAFKKQTIWTLTYLLLMAVFSLLELILFFGSLTGSMGA